MTEPSKFFTQHHAVEAPAIDDAAFRQYWKVRPRLDQLLLDRAITIDEWRAAVMFRGWAELLIAGSWPTSSIDRADKRHVASTLKPVLRRVDAINRLGRVRRALGSWAFDLLEAHIVDDLSWRLLGERYGVHAKTVRSWTIVALRALASITWAR